MSFPRRRESIYAVAPGLSCGWIPSCAGMTKIFYLYESYYEKNNIISTLFIRPTSMV
jgi:hypothetical protein